MTYSLTETDTMCRKAAKGSGMGWGLAEEAGKATVWLTSQGFKGPETLAALLETRENGQATGALETADEKWSSPNGLCPVSCGASLSDLSGTLTDATPLALFNLHQPLMLLPFLARIARDRKGCVDLNVDGSIIRVWPDGTDRQTAAAFPQLADCTITLNSEASSPFFKQSEHKRADIPKNTLDRLNLFAGRTYAPATEESRMLGAGAGTTDND